MTREFTVGANVDIDMGANPITNVEDPTNDQDAATKKYVDDNAGGATFGTPAIVLGTAAGNGTVDEAIRRDSTIVAFDATVPTTQAFGDSAAAGSAAVAARRDHKHAMPATPVTSIAKSGSSAITGAATLSEGSGVSLTQSSNNIAIAVSGASGFGLLSLVYRYTVAGNDKASIDTGADTADAGSNDWTNGDVLEVFIVGRTDDASARVNFDITLNNDTNAHYDNEVLGAANTTVAGAGRTADSTISASLDIHGSGGGASYPGICHIVIPNFTGTTFFKAGILTSGVTDSTAGNESARIVGFGFRSTAALTRMKIAAQGAAKFKVGTQLLIYKRLAS